MRWILFPIGVFAILGAALDWDFFMNNRKARPFVRFLGRKGARVFYALLGTFIIVCGVISISDVIQGSK